MKSEKKVPRSEEGTDENATPGIVVVVVKRERERKEEKVKQSTKVEGEWETMMERRRRTTL